MAILDIFGLFFHDILRAKAEIRASLKLEKKNKTDPIPILCVFVKIGTWLEHMS